MSSQPPQPEPDDFPEEGDGTTTIKYMVGSRLTGEQITEHGVPGHLIGELITRVSKLYSALRDGGENLSRAIDNFPLSYQTTAYAASIDVFLEYPDEEVPAATLGDDISESVASPVEIAFQILARLTDAGEEDVAEIATEYGGAVATAYRQLAALLGSKTVSATFFEATHEREPLEPTFVRLTASRASVHAQKLSDRDLLSIETVQLTGLLDELAGGRGRFKLIRPRDLNAEQDALWRDAAGQAQSIDGQLSDQAATDIRRLNAWSSRVVGDLEVSRTTAPTSTRAQEIDAVLLRIISVQPELDAD